MNECTQYSISALRAAANWQPISTAPQDGTAIDLWIVGDADTVSFYSPVTYKHERGAQGRLADVIWKKGRWWPLASLGYSISPDVTVTHWREQSRPQ